MGSEGTLPCPICDVGEEHCKCQKRAIFAEGAMQRIRGKREGRAEAFREAAEWHDTMTQTPDSKKLRLLQLEHEGARDHFRKLQKEEEE